MQRIIDKPFSPACEENKQPILEVLKPRLIAAHSVLEIGSGTGQHAVHFAAAMPHLRWQCTDVPAHLLGIRQWLDEAKLPNLPAPLALDMETDWLAAFSGRGYDAAFSANTAHIMSLAQVERLFAGVGALLPAGGRFLLYGPFSIDGQHTSESNARFDQSLRLQNPASGVRDRRELERFAAEAGLALEEDIAMPVNNRTLVWRRLASAAAPLDGGTSGQ
jgi:cyclopropane fatty-acyl-phospholipid synthase-like methyltransferase